MWEFTDPSLLGMLLETYYSAKEAFFESNYLVMSVAMAFVLQTTAEQTHANSHPLLQEPPVERVQPRCVQSSLISTYEQLHFYANKAKTEMRHFLSETLQNEIHDCKTRWDKQFQDILGFSLLYCQCPETPRKRDRRLKNEIGMNFSNTFLPPLI